MKAILLAYILTAGAPITHEQQEFCRLASKLAYDIQMARQESHDGYYLMRHKIMIDLPAGEFEDLVESVLAGVFTHFPSEDTEAGEIYERVADGCIVATLNENRSEVSI